MGIVEVEAFLTHLAVEGNVFRVDATPSFGGALISLSRGIGPQLAGNGECGSG
jgi:hypothetical protein